MISDLESFKSRVCDLRVLRLSFGCCVTDIVIVGGRYAIRIRCCFLVDSGDGRFCLNPVLLCVQIFVSDIKTDGGTGGSVTIRDGTVGAYGRSYGAGIIYSHSASPNPDYFKNAKMPAL